MWRTVELVGSGFTLAAFVAAAIASLLKAQLRKEEKLIRAAPPRDRAKLIENSLEFFRVDTGGLTQQHRFDIAIEQIRARARRFAITSAVILVLALLAASVTVFAIYRNHEEPVNLSATESYPTAPNTPTAAVSAPSPVVPAFTPVQATSGVSEKTVSETKVQAPGDTLPEGDVTIQNKATAMFMDLSGGEDPGEVVLVQSHRRKVLSQVWKIIAADELGSYYLTSQDPLHRGNHRCLEVKQGGANDQIGLGVITGAKKQQWDLVPADPGYYFIKSKFYDKTINAPGAYAIEQALIMYFFWRGNNEQWRFAPAD